MRTAEATASDRRCVGARRTASRMLAREGPSNMPEAKIPIPPHVLRPTPPSAFNPADEATRRAGLGHAILRALGAHERLPRPALEVVARWSLDYGVSHGGVTPDAKTFPGREFLDRLGPSFGAHLAARNAASFGGGKGGKASYQRIFEDVWVHQHWPDLCRALAGILATPSAGPGA